MEKNNESKFSYGMSLAASWAWGTSLVVGMELIQTRGLLPFIIWATANSLALPIFGFLAFKIPNLQQVVESKIVNIFTTIVAIFCLWIQMNAVYEELIILTGEQFSTALRFIIIAGFILMSFILNKNGVFKSMIMDNPLWSTCYLLLLLIMIFGFVTQQDKFPITFYNSNEDIKWAINSCFILFSGPVMCIQNWQFAKVLHTKKMMSAHYIAGILFAVYMCFVGTLGCLKFNGFMQTLLILVVLTVALSTGDSAIVGMQEIAGNKVGLIIACLTAVCWPFVISFGVMGLWTTMGNMRKYIALLCIIIAVMLYFVKKGSKTK